MNVKTHLVTGVSASGAMRSLYCGTDGGKAKEVYTDAINGGVDDVIHAQLFLQIRPDRRHDVVSITKTVNVETMPEPVSEEPSPEAPKQKRKK